MSLPSARADPGRTEGLRLSNQAPSTPSKHLASREDWRHKRRYGHTSSTLEHESMMMETTMLSISVLRMMKTCNQQQIHVNHGPVGHLPSYEDIGLTCGSAYKHKVCNNHLPRTHSQASP